MAGVFADVVDSTTLGELLDPDRQAQGDDLQGEPDIDQVEATFVEGFAATTDPTSFLRLANVPFEATAG